jgi:hypothetical protein
VPASLDPLKSLRLCAIVSLLALTLAVTPGARATPAPPAPPAPPSTGYSPLIAAAPGQPSLLSETPLTPALSEAIDRALKPARPDGDNALVRLATLRVISEDLPSELEEALTAHLHALASARAHTLTVPLAATRDLWGAWVDLSRRHAHPLTEARAVSVGRTLNARYLMIAHIGPEQVTATARARDLTLQVVSVRRGALLSETTLSVSSEALNAFERQALWRETRADALWRSALLPGWGQLYQDRPGAAVAYGALTLTLAAGALISTVEGARAERVYAEGTPGSVPYRERADAAYSRAAYLWAGLGAAWVASALDAYISGRDRAHLRLVVAPTGAALSGEF